MRIKRQVLVYGNRKQPEMQLAFSTQAEKEKVFLQLFDYLRKQWAVYNRTNMSKAQQAWYADAANGDGKAAINLLTVRKGYEYERWHIQDVPVKGLALKPHWLDVKGVSTRSDGSIVSVTLNLANNRGIEFLLVPHMTTNRDWDGMSAAARFIADALRTEWSGELHNAEGLKKALNALNQLRRALHVALHPETASPTCSPDAVAERAFREAEETIKEYSDTPIEKLSLAKRRPTTLDEAQEELAEAKRCIGSLVYYLKKAGQDEALEDLQHIYKDLVKP